LGAKPLPELRKKEARQNRKKTRKHWRIWAHKSRGTARVGDEELAKDGR